MRHASNKPMRLRIIFIALVWVVVMVVNAGDGYIIHDPEPLVVCEMGWTYLRAGK
jgi:hypothetical protein